MQISYSYSQLYSIDWKKWDGSVNSVTLSVAPGTNKATVHIDSYFTGTTRIRCQYKLMNNQTGTEYFDIICSPVTLNVSPKSISFQDVGDSQAITYTTSPSNKYPSVSYSSSNNSVATVNYAGVVTAQGNGTATITISNSMGPDATVNVSVNSTSPNPSDPESDAPDPTIKDGDYFQDNTPEGYLMLFIAGTFYGERGCYVVPTKYGGSCISFANGKVTIPNTPKGFPVRVVQNAAFWKLTGMTELVIPSTVTAIETNAIYGCQDLTAVICEATTPPQYLGSSSICNTDYKCTLYVPKGCKSKYESASGWKKFGTIKEIDPAGIALPELEVENNNAQIHTLHGQKVTTPQKGGLYIVGGKKVIVK